MLYIYIYIYIYEIKWPKLCRCVVKHSYIHMKYMYKWTTGSRLNQATWIQFKTLVKVTHFAELPWIHFIVYTILWYYCCFLNVYYSLNIQKTRSFSHKSGSIMTCNITDGLKSKLISSVSESLHFVFLITKLIISVFFYTFKLVRTLFELLLWNI